MHPFCLKKFELPNKELFSDSKYSCNPCVVQKNLNAVEKILCGETIAPIEWLEILKTEIVKFHGGMLCENITSKRTSILSKKTKSRILVFFKNLVNQYITFVLEHYSFAHFPF